MGNQQACIRPTDAKMAQTMFKVRNVDDKGSEIQRAVIEVTKTDIILHQRCKDPVKWPLRSLRRYGFDKKLFSFESGRRCATGPGIYAFKCKRAEFLFRNVQENAQACGNGTSNGNGRLGSYSASSDLANSEASSPTHRPVSPILSAFSADSSGLGEQRNGSAYGLATYSGRTLSLASSLSSSSSPAVPSPASPGAPVHYINASSFADIPESSQESGTDSSSVAAILLPRVSEESAQPSSEDEDPNVNYARLKHDVDEDSSHTSITETDAVTLAQNDVNGNMDWVGLAPPTTVPAATPPEPHYMKPPSVKDIINGNTSTLNLNVDANILGLTGTSSEGVADESHANGASPVSTTTPFSLVSQSSLTTPSCRTSASSSSYYANLDTVGELPHNNFVFCCDLRSPCSTSSSKGSAGSEFIFDASVAGNRSPVSEHSYANLDALSEVGMRPAAYSAHSSVVLQPAPKGRMNYADLDMESLEAVQATPAVQTRPSRSSSLNSSPPKTPGSLTSEGSSRRTDTYAMIDFNRTTALANSQRQIDESDLPGGPLRRTRHDSKIR